MHNVPQLAMKDHTTTTLFGNSQKLLYVCLDVRGQVSPAVTLERDSIWADEELFKVPGDVVSADGTPDDAFGVPHQRRRLVAWEGKFLLEEDEQRMSVISIHVDLLQELEFWLKAISRTDVFQRHQDLFIFTVFLNGMETNMTQGQDLNNTINIYSL